MEIVNGNRFYYFKFRESDHKTPGNLRLVKRKKLGKEGVSLRDLIRLGGGRTIREGCTKTSTLPRTKLT